MGGRGEGERCARAGGQTCRPLFPGCSAAWASAAAQSSGHPPPRFTPVRNSCFSFRFRFRFLPSADIMEYTQFKTRDDTLPANVTVQPPYMLTEQVADSPPPPAAAARGGAGRIHACAGGRVLACSCAPGLACRRAARKVTCPEPPARRSMHAPPAPCCLAAPYRMCAPPGSMKPAPPAQPPPPPTARATPASITWNSERRTPPCGALWRGGCSSAAAASCACVRAPAAGAGQGGGPACPASKPRRGHPATPQGRR